MAVDTYCYKLAPRKVQTSLAVDTYCYKLALRKVHATVSRKVQLISASALCCYTLTPLISLAFPWLADRGGKA